MITEFYEPLLTDAQAAEFLGGLHPKTVQRWRAAATFLRSESAGTGDFADRSLTHG